MQFLSSQVKDRKEDLTNGWLYHFNTKNHADDKLLTSSITLIGEEKHADYHKVWRELHLGTGCTQTHILHRSVISNLNY